VRIIFEKIRPTRAIIHTLERGPRKKVALIQIEIEKKLKPRLVAGFCATGPKSIADLDRLIADKIAPAVIGWLVPPIAAAVIGRTVGVGRSGERAEREAAKDARRDRPAPAASVPASAAPIAAVQASPVPTVAVPALCRGIGWQSP